jgi:hypothetical protein
MAKDMKPIAVRHQHIPRDPLVAGALAASKGSNKAAEAATTSVARLRAFRRCGFSRMAMCVVGVTESGVKLVRRVACVANSSLVAMRLKPHLRETPMATADAARADVGLKPTHLRCADIFCASMRFG